jgi:UDP-N-acetylmuramate dehydrogenase
MSEHVSSVSLCSTAGEVASVPAGRMAFGYDRSRLQSSGEILLTADFIVSPGEPAGLREAARRSLAYRKRTQPLEMPSAGCIFQNPIEGQDVVPDGIPWSAGALVDRAGMKGVAVGGARVSPTHGNFVVNEGSARAADIRQLVEQCRAAVRDRFGVELREEIVYLGDFNAAHHQV